MYTFNFCSVHCGVRLVRIRRIHSDFVVVLMPNQVGAFGIGYYVRGLVRIQCIRSGFGVFSKFSRLGQALSAAMLIRQFFIDN